MSDLSNDVRVFYDNENLSFNFTTGDWSVEQGSQWAERSRTVFLEDGAEGGELGAFSFRFNGVSVSLIGSLPTTLHSKALQVKVDDRDPFEIPLQRSSRLYDGVYRELFTLSQSQIGGHGEHFVQVTGVPPGFAVDFAAVTSSSRDAADVMVDDIAGTLGYRGLWRTMLHLDNPWGLPYGFTTHRTSSKGDTLAVAFSGTSVSVVGLFNITSAMTVRFHLDREANDIRFSPSDAIPSYNFPWYTRENLSKGPHVLWITLLEPNGQALEIDYIRYHSDTIEDRIAADKEARSGISATILIGILAGIFAVLLAVIVLICLFRRSSTRVKASRWRKEVRQRTNGQIDLDIELSATNSEPIPDRAGPNALIAIPSLIENKPTIVRNLQPEPFIIPASEWGTASAPAPRREKAAMMEEAPQEVQQAPAAQPPADTSRRLGELYRAVQLLTAETENLRGRLQQTPTANQESEPPPYDDGTQTSPISHPSHLPTPDLPSPSQPPGISRPSPIRKERR